MRLQNPQMIKIEQTFNEYCAGNRIKTKDQIKHFYVKKCFSKQPQQCFYRFSDCPKSVTIICTQQEFKQKTCSFRKIDGNVQQNQSLSFTQYTQTFYQDQFIKQIVNQNNSHHKIQLIDSSKSFSCFHSQKHEEDTTTNQCSFQSSLSQDVSLTNEEVINSMTGYLQSIRQKFYKLNLTQTNQTGKLNIKEGYQENLNAHVSNSFHKFFSAIRNRKNKQLIQNFTSPKKELTKNKYYHYQLNKILLNFFQQSKNEGRKGQKDQIQSEYHNLKNSFMQLITQLICPDILDCFDLTQYQKISLIETITRLKENSVKFRPVKGKYQYYSNLQYISLFLQFCENNFQELNSDPKIQAFHRKIYQLDVQNFKNWKDIQILRCNHFKSIFGQIIIHCMDIAESQIQINLNNTNRVGANQQLSSRYFYISKVKKGIQKLIKGQKIIRF